MSTQHKFFDEKVQTILISKHGILTSLSNLVELDSELHIINLTNNKAANFRVVWVNTQPQEGVHNVGLEATEGEADLWEIHFPPEQLDDQQVIAEAWLRCQRCQQKSLTPVPEAEYEFLRKGFLIARICNRCRATTPWEFTAEEEEPEGQAGKRTRQKSGKDLRTRGRVPIQMRIKVMRKPFGMIMEDICRTVNVSRGGACFLTSQIYQVGEPITVILPYQEGDLAMPVPGRVVRRERQKEGPYQAVGIHLDEARK